MPKAPPLTLRLQPWAVFRKFPVQSLPFNGRWARACAFLAGRGLSEGGGLLAKKKKKKNPNFFFFFAKAKRSTESAKFVKEAEKIQKGA